MKEMERRPVTVGQAGVAFVKDHMAISLKLAIEEE
jgi:hypothetical protein